jgi:cysteine-S-conjugate beta-lyase
MASASPSSPAAPPCDVEAISDPHYSALAR